MSEPRVRDRSHCLRCGAANHCVKPLALVLSVLFVGLLRAQEPTPSTDVAKVAPHDDALRRELLAMVKADQAARINMIQELSRQGVPFGTHVEAGDTKYASIMAKASQELLQVDTKNRERFKQIVKRHGWPGRSLVGKDGAQAAWLLVQHADADREFQKSCLQLMEALPAGEVHQRGIAYLTDRVLVGEKKPQRYGTQMDGEFNPKPLVDAKNVDKRRAEVGLPPLAEYIKMARETYETLSKSPPAGAASRSQVDAAAASESGNHLQGGKHGYHQSHIVRSLRSRPRTSRAATRLCATRRG